MEISKETKEKSRITYNPPTIKSWKDEGHFIIPNVVYRGKTGTYRLFEQMTPAMNSQQLAKFYEKEKVKGNPHPTDTPLLWAICTSAYNFRQENPQEAEKLKEFLKNGFTRYPNTLTGIIYSSSGIKDAIIHNWGTSDEYSFNGWFVGSNEWIKQIPEKYILEKLLGTDNTEQINKISSWINNTEMYIWRLNSKTEDKKYKGVGFVTIKDGRRFYLNCIEEMSSNYPAFRVLKVD